MADQNIYGIKYEVDIEDLKTSTSEASKKIRQANADFNEASSRLDNWATSTEGVSAKLKQLNTILEAEKSKLAQSQKAYNDNIDALNKYQKEIAELKAKKQEAIATYGAESKEVKELDTQIKKLERTQASTITQTDKLKVSITNQQATVNRTEKSIGKYEQQLEDVKEAQANAEKSGNSLESELKKIQKASDGAEDSTKGLGKGLDTVKSTIANFVAQGLSSMIHGIANAIEETREYRSELGKLQATAETMDASFDKAKDNLREITAITNDTGAGVEGLNNLLSAGFDGKQLDAITDQLLGASIKWKDTLKFEGLADGLQETLATGKAIGPFAEMLERAGGKLEDFDKGLAKATKSGKQQQYVLDYLAKYSLVEVKDAYEENNKTLIDSAKATYDYQDKLAQLSQKAEPLLTAVKRGFTSMLDEIVKASNSTDLSGVTNAIQGVMELVGKGVGFIISNLDTIIPVVAGLTTAWVTYKGAVLLASGVEKAMAIAQGLTTASTIAQTGATVAHTTATNGATIATKALALAQKLTPWGAIAGLITGVAVGLISYISRTDEATAKAKEQNKAITESVNKQKELTQARKDAIANATAEHDYNARLKSELDGLVGANGRVKQGYEARAGFIIGQLNEAYGTEITMINGVIQEYDKQMSKIDQVIEKQRAKAIVEAGAEEYTNAIKNQTKAWAELGDMEKSYTEAKTVLTQYQHSLMQQQGLAEDEALEKAKGRLSEDQRLTIENYEKKKKEAEGYTQTIAKQEELQTLYAEGSAKSLKKINDSVGQSYKKNGQVITLEVQKQLDTEKRKYNYLIAQYKKTGDDSYKIQANASKKRINELNKELQSTKSAVKTKTPEVTTAWGTMAKLSADAVKSKNGNFKSAGSSNAENVKSGLNSKKGSLNSTSKKIAGDMAKSFDSKKGNFKTAGKNVKDGIDSGMGDGGSLISKIGGWASSMAESFKRKFNIKSPSRVMMNIAKYIPEGVGVALDKGFPKVVNQMGAYANTMMDKYKDNIKGFDLLEGLQPDSLKGNVRLAIAGETGSSQGNNVNNITFNQYNQSPKALDSLEIYRQTQRQIKQLKLWKGGK